MNEPLRLVKDIEKELDRVKEKIGEISYEVRTLQDEAHRLEITIRDLSGNVITKEKFAPYEKLLGVIGVAVVLAIVAAFMASILK